MSKPRLYLGLWGPPIAAMVVIFAFSAMPSDSSHHSLIVFILRKVAHFSEYAILTALVWRAVRARGDRTLILAWALAVAYAATDEFHQTFVSGRVGTPRDVLIDAAGAAVAVLVIGRYAMRPKARA